MIFQATPALRRLSRALRREAREAAQEVELALVALGRRRMSEVGRPSRDPSGDDRSCLLDLARALNRLAMASDLAGRLDLRFGTAAPEPEQFVAEVPSEVPQVEFEAAWRDLLERDAFGAEELHRAGLEVADLYRGVPDLYGRSFYPHGFGLALAADREVAQRVRDRLAASIALGTPVSETAQILSEEWDWPRSYAETVTRTTVNTATNAGRFREAQRVQDAGIPVGFRFSCVLDSNLRQGRPQDGGENHRALHGLVARSDDPIWRRFSPPGGFNCFPGNTLVQGRVLLATRFSYAGEVVEILTKRGRRLTLTPNHRVVAEDGFARAGALYVGQNLLSDLLPIDRSSVFASSEIDEENEPATAEEVFRSLAERSGVSLVNMVRDDFDGDAIDGNGQVEVVAIDRELLLHANARENQEIVEAILVPQASRPRASLAKVDRSRRLGHLGVAALATRRRAPRGAALASNGLLVSWRRPTLGPLESLRIGAASRLDAPFLEPETYDPATHAEFARELLLRGAGLIAPDEIVHVERKTFAGHVYDLQTETGWIAAEGIYISNCRCSLQPVIGDEVPPHFVQVPPAASFAPGFGSRPDLRNYA